ncbi:MAG TPA: 4Fe-4S dicluster domain-containing protein [Anaeromyxobacteraceae bacterium]|nr:4Fe-4S dicluster domain-containing protein [Anaeromyxobacteraceae bacterium]
MGARLAFSIDLDRCIGCRACVVACCTGNELAPGDAFIAVSEVIRRGEEGLWGSFAHHRCFHCAEAACVEVCPTGALSKWQGLTAVAAERCSGCGYCVDACPFHVPAVRDGLVSKCVGCVDQVQQGEAAWCERTCPSRAIRFGDREALLAAARERVQQLVARHPRAQVYGDAQLGGLGLLLVLLDRPGVYGLPERPTTPLLLDVWQAAVQPGALGLSALAGLTMGAAFLVARRRRALEHEAAGADGPAPAPPAGKRAGTEGGDE